MNLYTREEIGEEYNRLKFTNDFLFCKILENNPELARQILERILDRKIEKVVVQRQLPIEITMNGKGVRLDVYAQSQSGLSVYDMEMQPISKRELSKRARYYQGMIDLNLIERGAKYSELKDSYVIFICIDDPFDREMAKYTFENLCVEDVSLPLGDMTTKIFLNASGDFSGVSPGLQRFLDFIRTGEEQDELTRELAREVEDSKNHDEWRTEYMTLYMRDQENIEKGIELERRTQIEKLLRSGKTPEAIADFCGYSLDEVKIIEESILEISQM